MSKFEIALAAIAVVGIAVAVLAPNPSNVDEREDW